MAASVTNLRRPCNWWRRYWHRRLRLADERMIVPKLTRKTFLAFTGQVGQEHWHCECSDKDYVRVVNSLR